MIAYLTLRPVFNGLLDTQLVQKIFHSVIIYTEGDERFPAFRKGEDFIYCGLDDTKEMGCYVRQTGDMVTKEIKQVSSYDKMYITRVPYRFVFFNNHETRNHDDIAAKLMNIVFEPDIEFVRFISDKNRLAQEETITKGFNFGGTTFYCAIDIMATVRLKKTNCEQVMSCGEIDNPIVNC